MRKNALVRAPRHARLDSPNLARREAASETPDGTGSRGAHYVARGRSSLQNARNTVGSWLDRLRFSAASFRLAALAQFRFMRESPRPERGNKSRSPTDD